MHTSSVWISVALVFMSGMSANAIGNDLSLLSEPGTDAKLARRVEQYCKTELNGISLKLRTMSKESDLAWPRLAEAIQKTMGKNDLATVLLSSRAMGSNTVTVSSNMPVAVVSLTDPRKDGMADDETYARWIERETLRAYGLVLGVKTCPNPQCAMSNYRVKPESLSSLGRNYCPYCRKCVIDQLQAKGVVFPEPKRVKKAEK